MPDLITNRLPTQTIADWVDPHPRDPNLYHVTDLIKAAKWRAKGRDFRDDTKEFPEGIGDLGKVWEHGSGVIAYKVGERIGLRFLPKPYLVWENITGSLDGLLLAPAPAPAPDGSNHTIVEIKLRYGFKSGGVSIQGGADPLTDIEDPRDNWDWMEQVKAYCYLAGVNQALMIVGHNLSFPPRLYVFEHWLTFTPQEIADTWQMVSNARSLYPLPYPVSEEVGL